MSIIKFADIDKLTRHAGKHTKTQLKEMIEKIEGEEWNKMHRINGIGPILMQANNKSK